MFVSLFSRGDYGCLATGLSLFGRGGLWLYCLGGIVRLREEFGTPSGLEILLGEGRDIELGARTSKHIFVFVFDPLSL